MAQRAATPAVRRMTPRIQRAAQAPEDPGPEPKQMTWLKALPVLGAFAVFDFLRFVFEWFILLGPALLGTAVGTLLSNYVGGLLAGLAGVATAGLSGFFGVEVFGAIGETMAFIIGFAGWIFFGLILLAVNRRIFKTDAGAILKILVGFLIAETPFIGSIPSISIVGWRLYHTQIKKERAVHQAWQARVAAAKQQEQEQLMAEVAERRFAMEQEARNQQVIENIAREEENSPQEEPVFA